MVWLMVCSGRPDTSTWGQRHRFVFGSWFNSACTVATGILSWPAVQSEINKPDREPGHNTLKSSKKW